MFAFSTRGCSGDRWKGNVQDKTKAETEGRNRRRGGGKKKKKTGTEIRFTLVAGVRDDFPYQQARGSGQI